jgi:uncharacterized cofD-like protein
MRSTGDLRVVAFGGGTGLPVLLRGLKDRVGDLTAIVTVTDDGGSSGRLREELGVAPPGDVRNCLVALAQRNELAGVFNYRFTAGDLTDHSMGNIIIAALADMGGGFYEGVEQAARFLRIRGRVYPTATEPLTLVVAYSDGTVERGESQAVRVGKRISRVDAEPEGAKAPEEAVGVLEEADLVILSSGSLFTSTIPSLLSDGLREALAGFRGPVLYVSNLMTQHGETDGFSLSDHLAAIADHAGPVVTDVLAHSGGFGEGLLARYRQEESYPVHLDLEEVEKMGVRVHTAPLLASGATGARHDPERLAEEVLSGGLVRL